MPYRDPQDKRARDRADSHVRMLDGRGAAASLRYALKRTPRRVENQANWNAGGRRRAHNLMRKYGMTLGQAEKVGVIPPDVQEALNGDR